MSQGRVCVSIPEGLLQEVEEIEHREAWVSASDMIRRLIERGVIVVKKSAPASVRAEVLEAYGTQTRRINLPLDRDTLDNLDAISAAVALNSRSKAVAACILAAIR